MGSLNYLLKLAARVSDSFALDIVKFANGTVCILDRSTQSCNVRVGLFTTSLSKLACIPGSLPILQLGLDLFFSGEKLGIHLLDVLIEVT